jgi:hypothetical protein
MNSGRVDPERNPGLMKSSSMNSNLRLRRSEFAPVIVVVLSLLSAVNVSGFAGHKQTFTGEVGDAMCGSKHMEGTPAECTRTCVSKGSKFALVVREKIYILDTTDQAALSTLNKEAGKNVTVTGTLNGDTIEVSSVTAK